MNHNIHKNALRETVAYSARVIPSIGFNRMRMKLDEHQHPALNMQLNIRVLSILLADVLELQMKLKAKPKKLITLKFGLQLNPDKEYKCSQPKQDEDSVTVYLSSMVTVRVKKEHLVFV